MTNAEQQKLERALVELLEQHKVRVNHGDGNIAVIVPERAWATMMVAAMRLRDRPKPKCQACGASGTVADLPEVSPEQDASPATNPATAAGQAGAVPIE